MKAHILSYSAINRHVLHIMQYPYISLFGTLAQWLLQGLNFGFKLVGGGGWDQIEILNN